MLRLCREGNVEFTAHRSPGHWLPGGCRERCGGWGCRQVVAALQQAERGQNKTKMRSLTKQGLVCHPSRISGRVRRAPQSRLQLLLPPLGWAGPFCRSDAREVRKHHLLTGRKASRCAGLFYLGVGSAQSWCAGSRLQGGRRTRQRGLFSCVPTRSLFPAPKLPRAEKPLSLGSLGGNALKSRTDAAGHRIWSIRSTQRLEGTHQSPASPLYPGFRIPKTPQPGVKPGCSSCCSPGSC